MNELQINKIYLVLSILDRKAVQTSDRACKQMEPLIQDIHERIREYLDEEFPRWKTDKELQNLFNRI